MISVEECDRCEETLIRGEAVDWSEGETTLLFKVLYLSLSLYLFKNNVVHWSDGEAILQLMF